MESNEILREQIFEIIENQLKANDPPETKATFKRLQKEGYNKYEAKQLIGQCVVVELFDIMKEGKPFDVKRYVKHLLALPKAPFD